MTVVASTDKEKLFLGWANIAHRSERIAKKIMGEKGCTGLVRIYGVPRGGIYAAQSVHTALQICGAKSLLVKRATMADVVIDDIIDSGSTKDWYKAHYPSLPFYALVNKEEADLVDWVVFPWEEMQGEMGPEENIVRIIEHIGENPLREGLVGTPKRILKSFETLYSGYSQDPANLLTTFVDGACDQMVVLRDIEFFSTCEHHMLPFFGRAHIGYIPEGRVIGVSKLARLLEVFSRRLQIQERIGDQVTGALMEHLQPQGCGCILEAKHLCMTCRGVGKQNSVMITSSMKGTFLQQDVKQEFLGFIK